MKTGRCGPAGRVRTIPNAGRKVLLWASVFLTAYLAYVLFDRVYGAWLLWQGMLPYGGSASFWEVEFGLLPLVVSEVLALGTAVAMLSWNVWRRGQPTSEVSYLFWIGLGIAAYFGEQVVVGIVSLGPGFTIGGWGYESWLQPAVPFVLGWLMVLIAIGRSTSRRARRDPLPVSD